MKPPCISRWLLTGVLCIVSSGIPALAGSAEPPERSGGCVWLDADGEPLPFQDHASILEVLRTASVLDRKKVGRGIAGTEKVTLEHDGLRFHAAFRTIDRRVEDTSLRSARHAVVYRDDALFEVAAYELSELLGIGRVPPVVARTIDGVEGTVQIWLEGATPEFVLVERGELDPPDAARFNQQKKIMRVFDNLIANPDRNQGNLLFDGQWTLWLIDHTRAFRRTSRLIEPHKLDGYDRRLWTILREADEETIRRRLEPYLEREEMSDLMRRRAKLIRRFEKLIARKGEHVVLFDLRPPKPGGSGSKGPGSAGQL